jgi:hypothetical protein
MDNYFMDFTDISNVDNELLATINFYDNCNTEICNFKFDTKYIDTDYMQLNIPDNGFESKKQALEQFIERLSTEHGNGLTFNLGEYEKLKIYKSGNELRFQYYKNNYDTNISVIIDNDLIKTFKKLINLY